jgi:DNA-binding GntR family transcriptional regulator
MAPGESLNERELGDQLGSSRTPVREALLLLAVEGLVAVHPHEGYFAAPLAREEGEDLFGLLGHIERRALARAGIPPAEDLDRLEELDRERRAAAEATRRMELDRAWHGLLLPAERVGGLYRGEIDRLRNRAARYELASLEDEADQEVALEEHAVILEAFRHGHMEKAAGLLEEHWHRGAAFARTLPSAEQRRTA